MPASEPPPCMQFHHCLEDVYPALVDTSAQGEGRGCVLAQSDRLKKVDKEVQCPAANRRRLS